MHSTLLFKSNRIFFSKEIFYTISAMNHFEIFTYRLAGVLQSLWKVLYVYDEASYIGDRSKSTTYEKGAVKTTATWIEPNIAMILSNIRYKWCFFNWHVISYDRA